MCCELRFVTFGRGTPFHIEAIVILPDHLHCVWTLGPADTDFSTRWSLIKGHFSRAIEKGERISQSRAKRGERGLWQRRFWEHLMRYQADFNRHVDYVHWNPVRHGRGETRIRLASFRFSMRSGDEGSIRRIGVARTSRVLRQGSNASDAVLFVHRILRVLRPATLCSRPPDHRKPRPSG